MTGRGGFDAATAFAAAPVAVLATVGATGAPHAVPVVFALHADGTTVYTAVDAKPKSTRKLKRLANIEENPRVSLLVDHYDDGWAHLWWVRADGVATVHGSGDALVTGCALLRRKYPQYARIDLDGPVIAVEIDRWASWRP